ncbi:erythromycin esterase family protein [Haloarchaeobius sp. FL176]|uniref:erythromycin esterase family protein n=1 Tax=Haloarchaeobius sp. FL176 TaxID=2967129 RepID=UPI002147F91A|nr:erythromycin esterase family protein [Haloarchaeobius sp. FL176]
MADETVGATFDEALVGELGETAVALDGTDPTAPLDDLAPLRDVLADVRVVGMGESTHGTRECFRFKHRLFRFLVAELDYQLFAIEANFSETLALNEYVVDGDGDPRDGLANIYFWTWATEEVLALVEWMREYNESRPRSERVRFHGIDAQYLPGAATALSEYLAAVDPEYLATVETDCDALAGDPLSTYDLDDDAVAEAQTELDRAIDLATDLDARLEANEDAYVEASSRSAFELARRHCRVLQQATAFKQAQLDDDGQAAYEVRDAAMAENVAWLLDYEDEHRVAVWAHDDHVRRGEVEAPDWTAETMGEDLDSEFGADYYALSLQFARGEFQVYDPDSDAPTRAVSIADPPAESLPNLFDTLGGDAAVLDLDAVDDGSPLEDWLAEPRRVHSIGATFDADDYPGDYVPAYDLRETFDGVAFVGDSTRARPVERGGE